MQIVRMAESDTIKGRGKKGQPKSDSCAAKMAGAACGLAVDIGTTTVVMGLYDLDSGERLAGLQEKNSQTLLGADVMMRLMHCQRGSQHTLEQRIREQIQNMAEQLCDGFCALEQIKTIAVVGNTTMCHIFLGQVTSGLAGSPFRPAYRGIYRCKGSDIDLQEMKDTDVIVPAGIDAHVGADAVSMICALQLPETKETVLAVDIGTNAEIALSCKGEISVCSAPAGPAFEGAQISQGMRGEPGAIAGMHIARQSGNILLEVIPDDRRNVYVSITDKGIEQRKSILDNLNDCLNTIIINMGAEKIETLSEIITEMSEIIEREFENELGKNSGKGKETKQ